ncbi:MAG TPA: hypothetical protein VLS89_17195, partial [Candidatus Nanopelagicales bacterium]|nr:hypothetical protein [Candidatus Nanopelagicales bacterium]
MRPYRNCIALLPIIALLAGACAVEPAERDLGARSPEDFLQPFLISFNRYEHHVIVFITDHPDYEAIEAMADLHPGRPPRIRATINLHDGRQIDHFNDPELARDRAAVFTGRETVHRPITFEAFDVNGVPGTWVQFTSYRGEDITIYFEGSSTPVPELGGFINPG